MNKFVLKIFLLLFTVTSMKGQSPWISTNSPAAGRYDDISFVNKDTGWAVNSAGLILHTKDGGNTWITQLNKGLSVYMRSIEFASPKIGYAGAIEYNGNNVFFKTKDGGNTWTDISSVITGTNRGICGICCVDTNVTYAVGVYASPAYVMKTINGGNTWTQINMSAYASDLVDVQFVDANNGYVTGQSNIVSEGAVILKTTNGGVTWTKVFTDNKATDNIWKIQNVDGIHWFASIEKNGGWTTNDILKSVDGGNTWQVKTVTNYPLSGNFQVVGFIDSLKGWAGGRVLYETIDGGNTWNAVDSVPAVAGQGIFDRFLRINSNTAYMTQRVVTKLQPSWVGVKEIPSTVSEQPSLKVFPNPTKSNFTIALTVRRKTIYRLRIVNPNANDVVWEEVGQKQMAGEYFFKVNQKLTAGTYFVYVMTSEGTDCKRIIVTE